MGDKYLIKNGAVIEGFSMGSTLFDIQGTQGQLFSVTDSLYGDIFSVSDITGIPILNVNSNGTVSIDGTLSVNGTGYFNALTLNGNLYSNSQINTNYLFLNSNSSVGNQFLLNASGANYGSIQTLGAAIWGLGTGGGGIDRNINNTALSWSTSGNVGVGYTTDQGYKLAVYGSINIPTSQGYRINGGRFVYYDGTTYIGDVDNINAGSSTIIRSGGLNALTISSTGSSSFLNTVTASQFNGSGAGLTGTASSLTAGSISNFVVSTNRSDSNNYSLPGRTTGMYAIAGGGSNGPGSAYLNLLHMSNATDVAFQIAGGYTSDNMYFRGTSDLGGGASYTPWRTVIHSGNIGSQNVQFANVASNCTNASYVNHYQSRTDAAWYNVVWASGSPSPMYSCDAIQIQSSTGIIKANNFTLGSDIRIKTEIKPISLEYIDIQYKEFELLSNLGEKRYGVIAQELLLLGHPELVSGSDTEIYSVKYIDLFVKEIAYLKNEVKLLKDEIQKLKNI